MHHRSYWQQALGVGHLVLGMKTSEPNFGNPKFDWETWFYFPLGRALRAKQANSNPEDGGGENILK